MIDINYVKENIGELGSIRGEDYFSVINKVKEVLDDILSVFNEDSEVYYAETLGNEGNVFIICDNLTEKEIVGEAHVYCRRDKNSGEYYCKGIDFFLYT